MYDLIIKNGTVIDGSGKEGFCADVAIKDGKIAAVGKVSGEAARVIDATGLTVTPGFIDSHSHADNAVLTFPLQAEKVEQGITTNIGGQCGSTRYPAVEDGGLVKMSQFMERACAIPQGSNIATFVGHKAVRKSVMGMENRHATGAELEEMKALVRDAMDAGAMGISFGMYYTPGAYASLEELIALATVAAEKNGIISAHIRSESDFLIESVEEFITIVKASGARGVLSHHKACMQKNHGKINTTLAMLEKANREGCDIYCDVYPYTASRTSVASVFIPGEYRDGRLDAHLKKPELRSMLREEGIRAYGEDISWVLFNACTAFPQYSGIHLDEAARLHGKDQWDTLLDILTEQPNCQGCFFTQREEDLQTVMAWPRAMICTDSGVKGNTEFYHPRLRGSFPRALGRYVREKQVVSLPEMIRKMTSLPAQVYGLSGKGLIREGMDGDICVFDPETIIDRATYTEVGHRAEGLRYVIVGGVVAAENALSTGVAKGRVLRRNESDK